MDIVTNHAFGSGQLRQLRPDQVNLDLHLSNAGELNVGRLTQLHDGVSDFIVSDATDVQRIDDAIVFSA